MTIDINDESRKYYKHSIRSLFRIILDLKDKIAKLGITANSSTSYNTIREEALSALTMLGFSKSSIEKSIDQELQDGGNLEVEELVKRVLKKM